MKILLVFLSIILLFSCTMFGSERALKFSKSQYCDTAESNFSLIKNRADYADSMRRDSILRNHNLVDIQVLDPSIVVSIKYFTDDNFMKIRLYNSINRAYFQSDVAVKIVKCQQFLKSINPDYSLLIYDAVRPVSVQRKMWEALDTLSRIERGKFVSNPNHRSMHNYGAAVDLTIIDKNGIPLDMGSYYDDIRKIAYPSLEYRFIATGELKSVQIENRKLLRKVMSHQHFRNIHTEWWHFNACSKEYARSNYKLLMIEPE